MKEPVDSVREALRALPRVRAREGFTENVLRRWNEKDHGEVERQSSWWMRWSVAAAIAGAVVLALFWEQEKRRQDVDRRERANVLRAEHQAIADGLEELRALVATEPVLVLGGGEDYDLVMTLPTLNTGQPGQVQPATYEQP